MPSSSKAPSTLDCRCCFSVKGSGGKSETPIWIAGSLADSYWTDTAARKRASLIFLTRREVAEGADRSTSLIQATVTPMRLWPLPWP